tara:strand:- start:363 stop:1115 length:753 start_codon:yes stop_codon:yes gene_type:complete
MKIKNWNKFQHFKDRKPLWIKLYRDLLNDISWHKLDGDTSKTLIGLWLLASEDKSGELPPIDIIAFRLRITEDKLEQQLTKLNDFLEQLDINLISTGYTPDSLEKRRDREEKNTVDKKASTHAFNFNKFWSLYPKKTGKQKCLSLWTKKKPPIEIVLKAVAWQQRSEQWKKGFIPNPSTWLNEGRWEDEPLKAAGEPKNIYSIKVASGEKIIDWRASESGINAKGKELNILPHDNESIKDYRRRLLQGES